MANKAFEFSSKVVAKDKIAGTFSIDGQDFQVRVLKDSSLAYLVAKISDGTDSSKTLSYIIDFTERALVPDSATRFEALVLGKDGGSGLELSEVMEVFQHVLELVAAGPTGGQAASASSRKSTSTRSKAATPAA